MPLDQLARAATDSFIAVALNAGRCSPQEALESGGLRHEQQEMLVRAWFVCERLEQQVQSHVVALLDERADCTLDRRSICRVPQELSPERKRAYVSTLAQYLHCSNTLTPSR